MATENSIWDGSYANVALGQSSADPTETVMIRVNPLTGALKCEVIGAPVPTIVDGGFPSDIPVDIIDGGEPSSIAVDSLDGGNP